MNFLFYGLIGFSITGFGYLILKKFSPARKKNPEPVSLEEAFSKTRESFLGKLKNSFFQNSTVTKDEIKKLEEILYTSDLGPKTVKHLITRLKGNIDSKSFKWDELRSVLRGELNSLFKNKENGKLEINKNNKVTVWMVVGVNGAGKTTTIGKLASQNVKMGYKVLIAAGDTFRAAADKQLETWSERAGAEFFNPKGLKDPSALAFEALKKAASKNFDLVLVDTAGRLHTQKNLMEELKKMKRVMGKALLGAPHETLLVLDANSGQNALAQVDQFHKALEISGIIITKMDSSAKGGVAAGISWEHQIPIMMIGVGEKVEDLRAFNSGEFVNSIL